MSIVLEDLDLPHWITTYTGRKFRLWDPDPEMIDLRDISAGLSKICRFAGQIDRFYSVAEHSLNVWRLCEPLNPDPNTQIACLLHDAAEAYIGDLPTPLKRLLADAGFPIDLLEDRILAAVWRRFGIEMNADLWDQVMRHDRQMLAREVRRLVPAAIDWESPIDRLSVGWEEFARWNSIRFLDPETARMEFERTAMELLGQMRDSR